MRRIILILSLNYLAACSVYESDARKFIREQGLEFKAQTSATTNELAMKHCKTVFSSLVERQYETIETDNKFIVTYNSPQFRCDFERTKPQGFSPSDYDLISTIVEAYKKILDPTKA